MSERRPRPAIWRTRARAREGPKAFTIWSVLAEVSGETLMKVFAGPAALIRRFQRAKAERLGRGSGASMAWRVKFASRLIWSWGESRKMSA